VPATNVKDVADDAPGVHPVGAVADPPVHGESKSNVTWSDEVAAFPVLLIVTCVFMFADLPVHEPEAPVMLSAAAPEAATAGAAATTWTSGTLHAAAAPAFMTERRLTPRRVTLLFSASPEID